MAVVPAWLAWPRNTTCHRWRGASTVATPSVRSRSARFRPCSTCTSSDRTHRVELGRCRSERVGRHVVDLGSVAHHLEHVIDVQPAGDRRTAEARHPKPCPLLVHEGHHRQRVASLRAGFQQHSCGLQRAHDPERTVVGAAVGLGVDMRPGAHPRAAVSVGRDRPQRACSVAPEFQADPASGFLEPPPGGGFQRRPRQPVPTGVSAPIAASSSNQRQNLSGSMLAKAVPATRSGCAGRARAVRTGVW